MSKGKSKNTRTRSRSMPVEVRKARTPAVIKAYSGSGFHTPGKYGTQERRAARREIEG